MFTLCLGLNLDPKMSWLDYAKCIFSMIILDTLVVLTCINLQNMKEQTFKKWTIVILLSFLTILTLEIVFIIN